MGSQKPFGVAFHYVGPRSTFINAYIVNLLQTYIIETEGNNEAN